MFEEVEARFSVKIPKVRNDMCSHERFATARIATQPEDLVPLDTPWASFVSPVFEIILFDKPLTSVGHFVMLFPRILLVFGIKGVEILRQSSHLVVHSLGIAYC